ncbi:hypothetical protein ACN2C6_15045 [Caulobacter sp. ErkDOM-YI]|uniref:hypothetical protein n=1 Tax=unclassified Caulobacter TaxID=2648921 RepID=UPI003AF8D069
MTSMRPLLVLLASLAIAGPALAQTVVGEDEVVSTAAHRLDARTAAEAQNAPAVSAPPPRILTTDEQIAEFLATSPALEGRDGLVGLGRSDEETRRKIHGSAGVTVGTGGYRSAYVSTLIPIGETSTLGLAYSQTDHGNNAVFHPYDDYGYGGYDRGGWNGGSVGLGRPGYWGRGGKQQSLAVSLAVGGDRRSPPDGCAPAFRAGDRYIEPIWATQMRGQVSPCAPDGSR